MIFGSFGSFCYLACVCLKSTAVWSYMYAEDAHAILLSDGELGGVAGIHARTHFRVHLDYK